MSIDEDATEEEAGTLVKIEPAGGTKVQPRSFLNRARRDLDEQELATPAARRFLIAEIERLDQDSVELHSLREKYRLADQQLAVLREQNHRSVWNELLSFICLSVGSAGLGAAPSYITMSDATHAPLVGWTFLALSAVLLITGVLSRIFK